MRNKIFEPLFGKATDKVSDILSEVSLPKEPIKNKEVIAPESKISKSNLGFLAINESKKKLLWAAVVIILILVLVYLISAKKKKYKKNPKRLISRFKSASKRESLEEN